MTKNNKIIKIYKKRTKICRSFFDNYVEIVNPWDSTKVERIPRGDFEQMAVQLNVAPMSKDKIQKPAHVENQSILSKILYSNPFGFLDSIFGTA